MPNKNLIQPEKTIEAQQNLDRLTVGQIEPVVLPPPLDRIAEEQNEHEEIARLRAFRDEKQDIEFHQIIGNYVESPELTVEPVGFLEGTHTFKCQPLFFFIPDKLVFARPDTSPQAYHAEEALKRLSPYFYWCAAEFLPDMNRYVFMYRKYYWVGSEIYRNATVVTTFDHRSSIATALLNFIEIWDAHARTQLDAFKFYDEAGDDVLPHEEETLGRFLAGIDVGITHVWSMYQRAYDGIGYYNLLCQFWASIEVSIEQYDVQQQDKLVREKARQDHALMNPKPPNKRGRRKNNSLDNKNK